MRVRPASSYPARPGERPPLRRKAVHMPQVDGLDGVPIDGDAPERRRAAAPLSQILSRVLKHYNVRLSENLDPLLADWPELAGPELAARLRPVRLEQDILYVYARSSAELFEIRRFKLRTLEARIRKHPRHRNIRQIRLQLDPGDEATP
ncbi:MAG: DUF721 domain-containing protein [Kiritimatiellia bacterium]|jgi:hypothetical protein